MHSQNLAYHRAGGRLITMNCSTQCAVHPKPFQLTRQAKRREPRKLERLLTDGAKAKSETLPRRSAPPVPGLAGGEEVVDRPRAL
jgi:hypothetical protein